MRKIICWLDKNFEVAVIGLLVMAITILMAVQVVMRYCFANSLSWVEETVVYFNIWIAFLGFSCAMKHNSDLKIDFTYILPKTPRLIVQWLSELILLGFYIYMVKIGFKVVASMIASGQKSTAALIPLYFVYSSIMVGSILAILRYFQKVYLRFSASKNQKGESK